MLAQKSILYNHPFLYILRAGLWNYELFLSNFTSVDYVSIKRYAETQSVVGLITAGFEKIRVRLNGKRVLPLLSIEKG